MARVELDAAEVEAESLVPNSEAFRARGTCSRWRRPRKRSALPELKHPLLIEMALQVGKLHQRALTALAALDSRSMLMSDKGRRTGWTR